MEQDRIDIIKRNKRLMDSILLRKIDLFEAFLNRKKPLIVVLCSESRIQNDMNKVVDSITNCDIEVIGTFGDIEEEKYEKILFSDAIIVNTLALKIAPKHIYNILKEVSIVNKNIYVLLSGWESISKTIDNTIQRVQRVNDEFPFSSIHACYNVYSSELQGFVSLEEGLKECITPVFREYDYVHSNQVEAIYSVILKEVEKYERGIYRQLQKEESNAMQISSNLILKMNRYKNNFSVSLNEITESIDILEFVVSKISIEELLYFEGSVQLKEIFIEKKEEAEGIAKDNLRKIISKEIESILERRETKESTKIGMYISDMKNNLQESIRLIEKSTYIEKEKYEELKRIILDTSNIESIKDYYVNVVNTVYDRVKDKVMKMIAGFSYDYADVNLVGLKIAKLISESNSDREKIEKYKEYMVKTDTSNQSKEEQYLRESGITEEYSNYKVLGDQIKIIGKEYIDNVNDKEWVIFQAETNKMLEYIQNSISQLLYDYLQGEREAFKNKTISLTNQYFEKIDEKLNEILMLYEVKKKEFCDR